MRSSSIRTLRTATRIRLRTRGIPWRWQRGAGFECGFSWQAPGTGGLSQLFDRGHVAGEGLSISDLGGSIAPLRVEKIQKTGGPTFVGVLGDVPGLFTLVDIT